MQRSPGFLGTQTAQRVKGHGQAGRQAGRQPVSEAGTQSVRQSHIQVPVSVESGTVWFGLVQKVSFELDCLSHPEKSHTGVVADRTDRITVKSQPSQTERATVTGTC